MSTDQLAHTISREAGVDLSSMQFRYIKIDSDGKAVKLTAETELPFGIVQNSPVTGQAASIAPLGSGGVSKIVLGGTIDEGVEVQAEYNSAADTGKAIAQESGDYPAGILIKGGAEDEIGEVLLTSVTVKA